MVSNRKDGCLDFVVGFVCGVDDARVFGRVTAPRQVGLTRVASSVRLGFAGGCCHCLMAALAATVAWKWLTAGTAVSAMCTRHADGLSGSADYGVNK